MTCLDCVHQACSTDMSRRGLHNNVVVAMHPRAHPWVQGGHPHNSEKFPGPSMVLQSQAAGAVVIFLPLTQTRVSTAALCQSCSSALWWVNPARHMLCAHMFWSWLFSLSASHRRGPGLNLYLISGVDPHFWEHGSQKPGSGVLGLGSLGRGSWVVVAWVLRVWVLDPGSWGLGSWVLEAWVLGFGS